MDALCYVSIACTIPSSKYTQYENSTAHSSQQHHKSELYFAYCLVLSNYKLITGCSVMRSQRSDREPRALLRPSEG